MYVYVLDIYCLFLQRAFTVFFCSTQIKDKKKKILKNNLNKLCEENPNTKSGEKGYLPVYTIVLQYSRTELDILENS
jgi:hypothetical protein